MLCAPATAAVLCHAAECAVLLQRPCGKHSAPSAPECQHWVSAPKEDFAAIASPLSAYCTPLNKTQLVSQRALAQAATATES